MTYKINHIFGNIFSYWNTTNGGLNYRDCTVTQLHLHYPQYRSKNDFFAQKKVSLLQNLNLSFFIHEHKNILHCSCCHGM